MNMMSQTTPLDQLLSLETSSNPLPDWRQLSAALGASSTVNTKQSIAQQAQFLLENPLTKEILARGRVSKKAVQIVEIDEDEYEDGQKHTGGGKVNNKRVGRGKGLQRKQKYERKKSGCLCCRTKRVKCDELCVTSDEAALPTLRDAELTPYDSTSSHPTCTRCINASRTCVWPEGIPSDTTDRSPASSHDDTFPYPSSRKLSGKVKAAKKTSSSSIETSPSLSFNFGSLPSHETSPLSSFSSISSPVDLSPNNNVSYAFDSFGLDGQEFDFSGYQGTVEAEFGDEMAMIAAVDYGGSRQHEKEGQNIQKCGESVEIDNAYLLPWFNTKKERETILNL